MTRPEKISFIFIAATLVLVGSMNMAAPFLTVIFSYFALNKLYFFRSKWLAVTLFLILMTLISYGFYYFTRQAIIALPQIASTSIPSVISWAQSHQIDLPFEDLESAKELIIETLKSQMKMVGNIAKVATKEVALVFIGMVVAVSLFLSHKVELGREKEFRANNLYTLSSELILARFRRFFESFATVMGAQILISLINTTFTSIFVLWTNLPYKWLVIGVTFLAGLLPILGNLISNTLIVGIAFTISPKFAALALAFLITIHKLEYFLNSKIIGDRIKNPMWLTLLAIIVFERLMGIPGMILAPVILHYIKIETSQIEVPTFQKTPDRML